ncbi:hypothetical protein BDZ91DRAFT_728733 [Kalaharituber pfeilii]|nr:hypothetical protein BDZ91DRAFT_728733 [Kalaharituber pfeilii]
MGLSRYRPVNHLFRAEFPYPCLVRHIQHYVLFGEHRGDVYTFTWRMKKWIRD